MSKKNTKRALLSSVLALVLCFAMLTGTTFAWFTDSVTSGKNQIVAGNLDVELEHTNEFVANDDVEGDTNLFCDKDGNPILWEPGVVAWENLTVKNVGNLALKYQLAINFENENAIIDGTNLYKLSDVLKVAVVDPIAANTSREDVLKLAKQNGKSLASFVENGELKPGAEGTKTYGLVIFWEPGPNDNNWNKNNGKSTTDGEALHIDLGIKLLATQMMHENDSFGKDYDEDAIYFDAIVKTNEELLAAIQDPEVKVIAVDENVTYDWGGDSYENSKALLMAGKTFFGMDGDEIITFAGYGSANPIVDVTLKDLTVADLTVGDSEGSWEHGHLEFESLTANNVVFANSIMLNGNSTLTNCSMNNTVNSWYGLWIEGGNTVIRDCSFTGTRAIKIHEAYGSEVGTVVIDNNEFVSLSEKPGVVIGDVNAATSISLTNNLFAGTQPGDQTNYKYESDTDVTTFSFVDENNEVIEKGATNSDQLKAALANNATVYLSEGVYTLPSMSENEGVTIIGAADGSTVVGGENASTGYASNFGKNTTIKNVTFNGSSNGVRKSYANGGTTTFENCTFAGDSVYGFHIDSSNGATFIFNNCTFSGFNAFAGDLVKVTFNNCTFLHNGNYGHTNIWSVGEFNNCTWGEGATYGTRGNGVIYIDGFAQQKAATQEELNNAVASGDNVEITLSTGSYTMPSSNTTGEVSISGTKDTVLDVTKGAYMDSAAGVTITGVTIKTSTGYVMDANGNKGSDYAALYSENVTYVDCTFVGPMRVGRDGAKFVNCTFTELGNDYIWTYGNDVAFEGCTFNTDGKAILIYSDGGNEISQVTVTGCVFNSTQGAKAGAIANQNCAAIEIHNYGNGVNLTTSGNTYDSNFSGEWRIKTYETGRTQIFVNGTEYTQIAIDGKLMTIDADKNVTVNG